MIIVGSILFGAFWGARTARKHGGKTIDMVQYATGFGIAFGILGFIVTIIIERSV